MVATPERGLPAQQPWGPQGGDRPAGRRGALRAAVFERRAEGPHTSSTPVAHYDGHAARAGPGRRYGRASAPFPSAFIPTSRPAGVLAALRGRVGCCEQEWRTCFGPPVSRIRSRRWPAPRRPRRRQGGRRRAAAASHGCARRVARRRHVVVTLKMGMSSPPSISTSMARQQAGPRGLGMCRSGSMRRPGPPSAPGPAPLSSGGSYPT